MALLDIGTQLNFADASLTFKFTFVHCLTIRFIVAWQDAICNFQFAYC